MKTLQAGDKVPQFTAVDQNGDAISSVDWSGKKTIVFFYPKANTPGCTLEACNLRDHYQELKEKGFQLIGVSADSSKKQKSFADKYELPFTLLADEDKTVIEAFGVWHKFHTLDFIEWSFNFVVLSGFVIENPFFSLKSGKKIFFY